MSDKTQFYIVRARAVPDVLRGVAKANELLASGKARTVNEAAEAAGISRSSYYKFKDDIEEFHDRFNGKTMTLSLDVSDESGVLSGILRVIAESGANILTIHQSIPLNGVALLTLTVEILPTEGDAEAMVEEIEQIDGVHYLKILGRE